MKLKNLSTRKKLYSFKLIGISILLIVFSLSSLYSCKKSPEECVSCQSGNLKANGRTNFNEASYSSYSDNNPGYPSTTVISKTENENIASLITSTLSELNLTDINTQNPIALCLFYKGEISSNNYDSVLGVIFYNKVNNQHLANVWTRNDQMEFVKDSLLSSNSTIISKGDMYKLNICKNLGAENILILLDQSKIANVQYPSIFQVALEKEYSSAAPNGGGNNGGGSQCSVVPECTSTEIGYCTFKEKQNGPTSAWCNTFCSNNSAVSVLASNNYNLSEADIEQLYLIRNEFLLNSPKGRQYIDDYYYASRYLTSGNISLSLALKLYNLYSAHFFLTLSNFDNTEYDNTVVITPEIKSTISEMISLSRDVSNDLRYNEIIDRIEEDVELYENKTLSQIKVDFH